MGKKIELKSIIKSMDDFENRGYYACIALYLKSDIILDAVNRFIEMSKSDIDEYTLDSIESIITHAKTIYEMDQYVDPFDDVIYDRMLSKFKKFRPEPFGGNAIGIANSTYKYDKLSGTLDKVHFIYNSEKTENDDRGSLEDYFKSIPVSDYEELSVLINQKKDGNSVTGNFIYKDGRYIAESGISRGKKDYGEGTDVSIIFKGLSFKPDGIYEAFGFIPKAIGVQFEFIISDRQCEAFQKYIGRDFANLRAASAGLLRRILFANKKDLKNLKNYISLVPVGFDVLEKDIKQPITNTWDKLYEAVTRTFIYGDVSMKYKVFHGTKSELLKQFEDFANKQSSKREQLNHAIDGMVMTILDSDIQAKMGRKNNINKFQIAYKFAEQSYKTKVRDVIITTGNFGYKEILLKVDPVILNGTKQFKAQVHSLNRFKKMDLRYGDEIILKLSGDVIPYGYKDKTCKKGDGKRIKLPTHCECGSKLIEEKNKLRCTNKACPYRITGSLINFFTSLNAKGIGEKTCNQLYTELGVKKPSDVLKLTLKDFKSLKGFKDASAKICMDTINEIINKPRTIPAILSALGIDSFRASTANKLLETVDIEDLIKAIDDGDKDKLIEMIRSAEGIDTNAQLIAEGLIDKIDELKSLLSLMTIKKKSNIKTDKIAVVSGFRGDDDFVDIANKAGYAIKDSGKKYDLLIIKDDSYLNKTKGTYAQKNNIPIITLNEFLNKYSS